jgi:hypothetical protein
VRVSEQSHSSGTGARPLLTGRGGPISKHAKAFLFLNPKGFYGGIILWSAEFLGFVHRPIF